MPVSRTWLYVSLTSVMITWGLNVIGDADAAVSASFDRYLDAISAI